MTADPDCAKYHTPGQPTGFVDMVEWAEKKMRTHDQHRCPICGLLFVWKPKPKKETGDDR